MGAQAPGAPGAGGAGGPGAGDPSQGQGHAPGGQPDYTKAWEEYYKKMGMGTHKQACLLQPRFSTM